LPAGLPAALLLPVVPLLLQPTAPLPLAALLPLTVPLLLRLDALPRLPLKLLLKLRKYNNYALQ
jgi:hypothetical protein